MSKTLLNIKTDTDVKRNAQEIAGELGLPLSVVVNAYLKEFIREREVRISLEPRLRPEIQKMLRAAKTDYAKEKNVAGPFSTAEDALRYLHS